ncbi:MAG: serine/threonine-protein kinase [Polyangiaceae bacterium]
METVGDVGAGHTLGRYELLIPLASGGMASVWAARLKGPRGFQKIVAVKLMLAELSDDPNFEKMFLDEAELASRIKHPNVVEIVDLGEQDGVLYQVMEWVDGEPLSHLIRELRDSGGVPLPVARGIVVQACAGLQAAHELTGPDGAPVGLVHRDVSPQNLLLGYDGNLKVVDFGVAKAESNRQQTVVGQMKGKAPYMAPEQALGEKVDRRTDVFALGIVLFQLLTGKHPFRAENDLATLRRIVGKDAAPRARQAAAHVPEELDDIIARALEKKPEARFASMVELARAVEAQGLVANKDQVAEWIDERLGGRGEKRRAAIRNAVRIADERHLGLPATGERKQGQALARRHPPSDPGSALSTPPPSIGGKTMVATPQAREDARRAAARTEPKPGGTPSDGGHRGAAPDPTADLERLARPWARPPRETSTVTAVIIVGFLAAIAVGLYMWETERREVDVPGAPAAR